MPAPPRLPRGPKPRALLIELIPVLAETGWVAPAQLPTVLINDSIHGLAYPSPPAPSRSVSASSQDRTRTYNFHLVRMAL